MAEITDAELQKLKKAITAVLEPPLSELDERKLVGEPESDSMVRIIRAVYEELAELAEEYGILCCCSNCTRLREEQYAFAEYDMTGATVH